MSYIFNGAGSGGGGGTPGAPVNSVQFNLAGAFAGDADFTWVAGSGLTDKKHMAVGNTAVINSGNQRFVINAEEVFTGDFSGLNPIGIVSSPTLVHTGAGVVPRFAGMDAEIAISPASTGDIQESWGLLFFGINDRSTSNHTVKMGGLSASYAHAGLGTSPAAFGADIAFLSFDGGAGNPGIITDGYGTRSIVAWYSGVGAITNAYTFYASAPDGGLANTNTHGLYIEDHSGIGSTASNNITSKGANSLNYIEGSIEMVEKTAPAAPPANHVRVYAQDNGAGKTQLMALFATGAAQQIAIEP